MAMMDGIRRRLERATTVAQGAKFAVEVLNRTGFLGALSASGVVAFARNARNVKPGPHMGLMLHAANKPEKLAVRDAHRALSYGELDREINQIAHALRELGTKPGDRVAIMLPNCSEYVVVQQALMRYGATSVQVGYRLKAAEIAYILENSTPSTVIVHHDYVTQMNEARASAGGPDSTKVIIVGAPENTLLEGQRYERAIERQPGDRPPKAEGKQQSGVIVYTSGTTGKPKGANRDIAKTGLTSVGDFIATVGMHHSDKHLVVCPLYHSAAPAFAAMMFSLGASVYTLPHFDGEAWLDAIEREKITCSFMVPTMFQRILSLPEETLAKYDTSSLRWICSGAAPLATETAVRFQERFGKVLWNFYGSTETGLVTLAGPDDHATHPGTVGRLVRGNEVRLLGDDGNEVDIGEVGELYARNAMLIGGYHRNRDATDKSMIDGYFSVGDLARMDADGFYYLESRKHDMVISGGVNIYPAEIENHLHSHPEILEAAVIGVPDADWGESLMAFVVKRPNSSLTVQEVSDYCRDELADYKRPRTVEFMDALPRNMTGKILKRELRERAAK
jgi:fatty-acyl-CoA synthase